MLCGSNIRVLLLLLNLWLINTTLATEYNKALLYDANWAPLNKTSTETNRIVSQVKKIVNDLRLKTKTTFQKLTGGGSQSPSKVKDTINTTTKPLVNATAVNTKIKKKTHRNKLKTPNGQSMLYYYGALNKRFREEPPRPPPEVIDN